MKNPQFAIITTTYKRPDLVLRSVASVEAQNNTNWDLYVVIDDTESSYENLFELSEYKPKIHCLQNKSNMGKNASANRVLDLLSEKFFTGYIIFLDDDDWLDQNCLSSFADTIRQNPNQSWLVTNRNNQRTTQSYTNNKTGRTQIYYPTDVLLFRRFWGDATHCLKFSDVQLLRFPTTIKNAEEWIYFCTVAKTVGTFLYNNNTGTWSDGYEPDGLTNVRPSLKMCLAKNKLVWDELLKQSKLLCTIPVITYFVFRVIKSFWR